MLYKAKAAVCSEIRVKVYAPTFLSSFANTDVPPYLLVILSKTYRGQVKPRIMLNSMHNVIFV
jgi:hypothetical protein